MAISPSAEPTTATPSPRKAAYDAGYRAGYFADAYLPPCDTPDLRDAYNLGYGEGQRDAKLDGAWLEAWGGDPAEADAWQQVNVPYADEGRYWLTEAGYVALDQLDALERQYAPQVA